MEVEDKLLWWLYLQVLSCFELWMEAFKSLTHKIRSLKTKCHIYCRKVYLARSQEERNREYLFRCSSVLFYEFLIHSNLRVLWYYHQSKTYLHIWDLYVQFLCHASTISPSNTKLDKTKVLSQKNEFPSQYVFLLLRVNRLLLQTPLQCINCC